MQSLFTCMCTYKHTKEYHAALEIMEILSWVKIQKKLKDSMVKDLTHDLIHREGFEKPST